LLDKFQDEVGNYIECFKNIIEILTLVILVFNIVFSYLLN